MLQATARRLDGLEVNTPIVVCNERHRFFVVEQMSAIGMQPRVVLEPEGRNTAPAIALAALAAQEAGQGDVPLLVLPADHEISEPGAFVSAVETAIPAARSGRLVTFGVVPTAPETGYGYIQARGGDGPRARGPAGSGREAGLGARGSRLDCRGGSAKRTRM